jgi:putative ABC transport system permease protein
MNEWMQDVKYAWRLLRKAPGFTLVVVVTLGLGIGANTAIFSVMNAVLLRPLPYEQPAQIAALTRQREQTGERNPSWSIPDFKDLQTQTRALENVAVYTDSTATMTGNGEPRHLVTSKGSAAMFSVLRVTPAIGRAFELGEDAAGHFVAMLSYSTWQAQFGGDPRVLGRSIVLDGQNYTVVGVLPASFKFPFEAEEPALWITFSTDATPDAQGDPTLAGARGAHFVRAIGRVKPGATWAAVNQDLKMISDGLQKEYPDTNKYWTYQAKPAIDELTGGMKAQFYILLGAVMLVLLIACANVANLMLAKASGREREIGIRYAMGATRGRLVRQFLIESFMLAFGGGICGLILAAWIEAMIRALGTGHVPRISETTLDGRVLIFSLSMMLATAFLFGLAPAMQVSGRGVGEALKEGGRAASQSQRQIRIKNALVTVEMIFAVILLTGAGLLMKSLGKLQNVSPGFKTRGLMTFQVSVPYQEPDKVANYFKRLMTELRAVPGVTAVSAVSPLPLSGDNFGTSYQIEGRPVAQADEPIVEFRMIETDYFSTMGIPLLAGRPFTEADTPTSTPVVIINSALAEKSFHGENPIGKHIKPGISTNGNSLMREIVGVVAPAKHRALTQSDEVECYIPEAQIPFNSLGIVLRSSGDGGGAEESGVNAGLMSMVRERVSNLDKDVPIYDVKAMQQYVDESIVAPRMDTELLGCFAVLAVILAVVGIYGVMSYGVSQRTGEIGIRMALGAQRGDVMRLILWQALKVTGIGVAIGAIGSIGTNRLLESLLFGVRPVDVTVFLLVVFVLVGCALAACWVPARRAMEVSPMEALRYE